MDTQKNLHASIPPSLLNQVQQEAQAQQITIDEVMCQAVERYLEDQRWKKIYAFGERQARSLGIKESDVDRIIHESRNRRRDAHGH